MGWDSVVSIVTGYRLNDLGIKIWLGRDFLHPSRPALGPTWPPIRWVLGLFFMQSGQCLALTTHSHLTPRLREKVELYLYSSSGPSWPVTGWTLPLLSPLPDMYLLYSLYFHFLMYIIQYYVAVLMNEYNISVLNTKTNAILHHHLALYYLWTLPHLIGSVNSLFIWHLSLQPWTSKLQIHDTRVWNVSYLKNGSKHTVWIIILTENII